MRIDYNKRQRSFYLTLFDPSKSTDVRELQQRDQWAVRDIERLQTMIDTLQQYRQDMADRAAYLLAQTATVRVVLKRYRHYKGSVEFHLLQYSTYPDGSERVDTLAHYPGKARAQAIREFREYKKQHTGTPCTMEIDKSPWEK